MEWKRNKYEVYDNSAGLEVCTKLSACACTLAYEAITTVFLAIPPQHVTRVRDSHVAHRS